MDSKILAMFKRIKTGSEGPELIEYLELLSKQNYEAYKRDKAENNEIDKGYAICVDSLIKLFAECDKDHSQVNNQEWI